MRLSTFLIITIYFGPCTTLECMCFGWRSWTQTTGDYKCFVSGFNMSLPKHPIIVSMDLFAFSFCNSYIKHSMGVGDLMVNIHCSVWNYILRPLLCFVYHLSQTQYKTSVIYFSKMLRIKLKLNRSKNVRYFSCIVILLTNPLIQRWERLMLFWAIEENFLDNMEH